MSKLPVQVRKTAFVDEEGRELLLRGINVGGSTKLPTVPHMVTRDPSGLKVRTEMSFICHPFPLEEADTHFRRLREWGFNVMRFVIPWEALEHDGPGKFDVAYMDYIHDILAVAQTYGINAFIDPHQDVWSRFSGGDGAPAWTMELLGMDLDKFYETKLAFAHSLLGDACPPMLWPTNYYKYVTNTMFTLFFGGKVLAPKTMINGVNAQDFLNDHFLDAFMMLAEKLKDLNNVIGFDIFNETWPGYIGWKDVTDNGKPVLGRHFKETPTPFEAMQLSMGFPMDVDYYEASIFGPRYKGKHHVNPDGVRMWREGYEDPWKQNGVWGIENGKPVMYRPDYFSVINGRPVNYHQDFLQKYIVKFTERLRAVNPNAIVFIEGGLWRTPVGETGLNLEGVVHASHWYDGLPLYTKKYFTWFTINFLNNRFVIGKKNVQRSLDAQLASIKEQTKSYGEFPTLIGEFGVSYDMWNGRSFKTGDYSLQCKALDGNYRALEANLLHSTLWNYTADNDHRDGDGWNAEDFSVYSKGENDDPNDINAGGRAMEAFVRPYTHRTAGKLKSMSFDMKRRVFKTAFHDDPAIDAPTELFVPRLQYPNGYDVLLSDGSYEADEVNQRLWIKTEKKDADHTVELRPAGRR